MVESGYVGGLEVAEGVIHNPKTSLNGLFVHHISRSSECIHVYLCIYKISVYINKNNYI